MYRSVMIVIAAMIMISGCAGTKEIEPRGPFTDPKIRQHQVVFQAEDQTQRFADGLKVSLVPGEPGYTFKLYRDARFDAGAYSRRQWTELYWKIVFTFKLKPVAEITLSNKGLKKDRDCPQGQECFSRPVNVPVSYKPYDMTVYLRETP